MTVAILEVRPTALPRRASCRGATTDLPRLIGLDQLATGRRPLVCRWHRDADGRLACLWEPDIGPAREH